MNESELAGPVLVGAATAALKGEDEEGRIKAAQIAADADVTRRQDIRNNYAGSGRGLLAPETSQRLAQNRQTPNQRFSSSPLAVNNRVDPATGRAFVQRNV